MPYYIMPIQTNSDNTFKNRIDFPATITIIKRKRDDKIFEHWYITIPVAVRKLIEKKNATLNVTLEKI